VIRTTEESLKAKEFSYRESSLALGATKLQTIRKVVMPMAFPNGPVSNIGFWKTACCIARWSLSV
jgi:ABC-type phosphate transport system permease subunit